ncbi:MAG: hypothetical protein IKX13_00075, partial [Bacteroidales bacterium]|nr:hypothetical protein [Bacteroidales bacterium]
SVAYVDRPLYHYLIRPGSVTTTMQSDKYKTRLAVFDKLMQYARTHGVYDEFKAETDYLYLKKGYLSSVTNHIRNSSKPSAEVFRAIHDELVRLIPDYRENRYLKRNRVMRLLIWMLRHCPVAATIAMRWYIRKNNIVS